MTSEAEHTVVPRKNLVAVFSNGLFRRAFLAFLAWSFLFGVILAYAPLYAHKSFGFPDEQITALFFGYFAFTSGVRLFMNKLTRRFSKEKLLVSSLLGGTVMTLLMALGGSPATFAVAFVLLGVAQGIVYPTSAMIVAGAFGLEELLSANSIYLSASDLGQTLGPVFASVLAENYGIPYALSISSIPVALAGILVVRTRSPKREG